MRIVWFAIAGLAVAQTDARRPYFFEHSMRFAGHPDVIWFLFDKKGVRFTADNVRTCIEQGADVNFLEKLARQGVLPDGVSLYPALQTSEPRLIRFVLEHSTTSVSQATLRFDEPGHPDDNKPLTCAHAFTDSSPRWKLCRCCARLVYRGEIL